MARRKVETAVDIQDALTTKGTVTIKEGELKGERDRAVVLEATPASGYVFAGWEIETTPARTMLRVFGVVGDVYNTVEAVCSVPAIQSVYQTLYTDGSKLYTDEAGKFEAAFGYWDAGNGQYLLYDGSIIPVPQVCLSRGATTVPQQGQVVRIYNAFDQLGNPIPNSDINGFTRLGDGSVVANRDNQAVI